MAFSLGPAREMEMQRSTLKSSLFGLVTLGLLAGPALAQTKMDCSRLYKDFWEKLDREKFAKLSAEELAGVSRLALRAYDACQAGDEQDATQLFDKLNRMHF